MKNQSLMLGNWGLWELYDRIFCFQGRVFRLDQWKKRCRNYGKLKIKNFQFNYTCIFYSIMEEMLRKNKKSKIKFVKKFSQKNNFQKKNKNQSKYNRRSVKKKK